MAQLSKDWILFWAHGRSMRTASHHCKTVAKDEGTARAACNALQWLQQACSLITFRAINLLSGGTDHVQGVRRARQRA